jgi:hypothetical protein
MVSRWVSHGPVLSGSTVSFGSPWLRRSWFLEIPKSQKERQVRKPASRKAAVRDATTLHVINSQLDNCLLRNSFARL